MKMFKKITQRIHRFNHAFKNKPDDKITFGVDFIKCDECELRKDNALLRAELMSTQKTCVELTADRDQYLAYSNEFRDRLARLRAELDSYKSSEITAGAIRQSADAEDKPSFDWEGFKAGKLAVHCDTEEKAKAFLNECAEHGITWCSGASCRTTTCWEDYRESTCYDCEETSCRIQYEHITGEGIKVIPYISTDTPDDFGSSGTTE